MVGELGFEPSTYWSADGEHTDMPLAPANGMSACLHNSEQLKADMSGEIEEFNEDLYKENSKPHESEFWLEEDW